MTLSDALRELTKIQKRRKEAGLVGDPKLLVVTERNDEFTTVIRVEEASGFGIDMDNEAGNRVVDDVGELVLDGDVLLIV